MQSEEIGLGQKLVERHQFDVLFGHERFIGIGLVGQQARGSCPLHGARAPGGRVFAVHWQKNIFHCFVCGAGGNALDLWAAWTRQDLYAAVVDLFQRLGRDIPWLPASPDGRRLTMPDS